MSQPNKPSQVKSRLAVLNCLQDVLADSRPIDSSFEKHASNLGPQDKAFAYALIMTTLRHYGWLQHVLNAHMRKPLPASKAWLSRILAMAVAQILWMRVPDHASISTTLQLLERRKAHGFKKLAHGILSTIASNQETILENLDVMDNLPKWLQKRWVAHYGKTQATNMALACTQPAPIDLTIAPELNTQLLQHIGATCLSTGSWRLMDHQDITTLPGYHEGHWWVQGASAALPVSLLPDLSGKHVLEIGSAPGGKTAQLLHKGAILTAIDRSESRLKRLRENMTRLQCSPAHTICADATNYSPKQRYDVIFIDAPCSATGTLRQHPELAHTKQTQDIKELAKIQQDILSHIPHWAQAGATIIYCTCSLEPEENEQQINAFLNKHPSMSRDPYTPDELPKELHHCISDDGDIHINITDLEAQGGMDGFYVSRLKTFQ